MAGSKKPTKGSSKKTASTKAKTTPAKPRTPKPGPRCIRNLLGIQQNLRLQGDRDKPYAVTLRPRGQRGDSVWVPLACQSDTSFMSGLDRQFEIITEAEYKKLQTEYPPVGYAGRTPMLPNLRDGAMEHVEVKVIRPSKSIVEKTPDPYAQAMDQQSNRPERRTGPVGPRLVNLPGGQSAMGQADPGADNAALMQQIDAQAAARRPAPRKS